MRNAVLSILGDMVSLVLKGEELEDKQKKIRDDFLMYLQDHMHDVHAFVRTKVCCSCKQRSGWMAWSDNVKLLWYRQV